MSPSAADPAQTSYTTSLLLRAHSPPSASRIFTDKIKHKPLLLTPTTLDARTARRAARAQKKLLLQRRRRKAKPRPLSAREKRALCIYEIPKAERRWDVYVGLNRLWCGYMREVLGISEAGAEGEGAVVAGKEEGGGKPVYHTAASAGPKIASADFHGAEVEVVRSRCVSRVGVRGIVVRDTKFTFEIVTRRNEMKVLPKEHSIFRFEVPLSEHVEVGGDVVEGGRSKSLIFELHGSQFENRAPERANKKWKLHLPPDL